MLASSFLAYAKCEVRLTASRASLLNNSCIAMTIGFSGTGKFCFTFGSLFGTPFGTKPAFLEKNYLDFVWDDFSQ